MHHPYRLVQYLDCDLFPFVCLMVFNVSFNNSSGISWLSVLLVEETGIPRGNRRSAASHCQTLLHNVVHPALIEIRALVVIGTDCIGSRKSNYHTITITTAPITLRTVYECQTLFCKVYYIVIKVPFLYIWTLLNFPYQHDLYIYIYQWLMTCLLYHNHARLCASSITRSGFSKCFGTRGYIS